MKPINIAEFNLDTLKEYTGWWGERLKKAAIRLKEGDMEHFTENMAAVIGLITLYDIYLEELGRYGSILERDEDGYNFFLDDKDFALEIIEKMEDWLYGTERLRQPVIKPVIVLDREV